MKLWGGDGLDGRIERFTVGNDPLLDQKLIRYDCLGSIAHARMLGDVGLITQEEAASLARGLEEIISLAEQGQFIIRVEQEDCHTAIEDYLTQKLGDVGKKLHTGRSRNDQVLTAMRLYCKDALQAIKQRLESLRKRVRAFARVHLSIPMPGFTHTRKAMPSSVGMWAGALADSLADDRALLRTAKHLLDQSPLGSGAGYGVSLPLDRQHTARALGFRKVQQNPIYVQQSRGKFEAVLLNALGHVLIDLNRAATDLILFSMPEFGFFQIPVELCTGSSIMPQKQNPDVLELVRARYHLVLGLETQVRTLTANMIHGYHRDLQLTKEPTMRGLEATLETIEIMHLVFDKLRVDKAACKRAMTPELFATEEAFRLVEQGVPFREAYRQVKERLMPPSTPKPRK